MLKKAIIFYIVIFCNCLSAQEFCLSRNYTYNNLFTLNPAAAGFNGALILQGTFSKNWLGIKDSPESEVFSSSIRLGEEEFYNSKMRINKPFINMAKRVGLGLSIFNETNGPLRHTGLLFAYSYHISVYTGRLSLGMSGLLTQYKLNTDKFEPVDIDDPELYSNSSALVPDINAGIMFYNPDYFIGFSAIGLINFNEVMDHTNSLPEFIGCVGYKFKVSKEIDFEPSLFIFKPEKSKINADINIKLYYMSKYWLLLSYKIKREFQIGCAIHFRPGLQFCYSYAVNINGLAKYFQGSQIISIRAEIPSFAKKKFRR